MADINNGVNYPANTDTYDPAQVVDGEIIPASEIQRIYDILNKIEKTVGINPQGNFSDVATRLLAIEAKTGGAGDDGIILQQRGGDKLFRFYVSDTLGTLSFEEI